MENNEWHRKEVGGLWDEIGKLQLNFMVNKGLLPAQKLLDVGCGSLRGGIHFINYLNEGNYYGIDINEQLLKAGVEIELLRYGLENKKISLLCNDGFEFELFNTKFEYAVAQSVFTHLPWNSIVRCLINIEKVLSESGRFYVTFFENDKGLFNLDPNVHTPGGIVTYLDKDPYHYTFDVFDSICKGTSLSIEYIGGWNHPRDQKMIIFKKETGPQF